MRWPLNFWHKRQRALDMKILWPSCRDLVPDIDHARAAFAVHAFKDPAWLSLGESEIVRIIDGLS